MNYYGQNSLTKNVEKEKTGTTLTDLIVIICFCFIFLFLFFFFVRGFMGILKVLIVLEPLALTCVCVCVCVWGSIILCLFYFILLNTLSRPPLILVM